MTATRSLEYHWSVSQVARWCAWYTRDLSPDVAEARRDEVASDLYEHGSYADELGLTSRTLARSIMARAVLGVPADLSWRRSQSRKTPAMRGFHGSRAVRGGLPVFAYTIALLLFTFGGFVLVRMGMSAARGEWWDDGDLAVTVVMSTVVSGCALILLMRARTRSVGALWFVFAVYGLVRYGGKALFYSSATYANLAYTVPGWSELNLALCAGLGLFFLAMALWWWPAISTGRASESEAAIA